MGVAVMDRMREIMCILSIKACKKILVYTQKTDMIFCISLLFNISNTAVKVISVSTLLLPGRLNGNVTLSP